MESTIRRQRYTAGFSLGEMLVTVVLGGMLLTAILNTYNRANRAASAVLEKIESSSLASEVLQLFSEDFDRVLGVEDLTVQIRNGFDNGFVRSELILRRLYHDKDNKEQTLEEITWRAGYDGGGVTPGLIIYRGREGAGLEDKLLERQRKDWEKNYPLVPICRGVTFFQIQAVKGEELLDQWPLSEPPPGVRVTISFAEPYETVRGTRDVRDDQKTSRTFVINAVRKIRFVTDLSDDPNASGNSTEAGAQEQRSSGANTPTAGRNLGTPNGRTTNVQSPQGSMNNERIPLQTRPR
ncbi:MAG TPA: prepilin-type N-terminal cleavage/methylation domain-containing protein [Sedimentisphaerales bacterium]|nr:prepilin-type N-terminal cleavage/methylation domain-containing protein [Sedimentisphaerales bacterium]